MWRCFFENDNNWIFKQSLLHACGGVSCAWLRITRTVEVFSTHVEVFLSEQRQVKSVWKSSPRMWRCFPALAVIITITVVFSTHVEVFLDYVVLKWGSHSLLHACGGVSNEQGRIARQYLSSPRMWRCFCSYLRLVIYREVFSTHVEVFLTQAMEKKILLRLLHACGGVSYTSKNFWRSFWSSPRMWRCFWLKLKFWKH